jgi:hypothetical protein
LKIRPLLIEIDSWLTSLLRNQLQREPWSKELLPSKLALGIGTSYTCSPSESLTIGTSITFQEGLNTKSSVLSLMQSEKVDLAMDVLGTSRQNQLEPPWMVWHRPTSWLTEQTPGSMQTGNLHLFYSISCEGYSVNDTPDSPQVAITASVLRKFYDLSISLADKALCELFIGAFFFAMRSCKYVKVSGQRKTKILMVKNISFLKGRRTVPHSDPFLHLADCISITFENQKRDTKNDTITQHRSSDSLLCPVRIWASIVRRLSSYPSFSQNMMVNSFLLTDGSIHLFTGTELLKKLRRAATALGPDVLDFTSSQIGLHSARSGAAMAMYLTGVPAFTIMLLGRWASDAFLRYIRKQVKEFSSGISEKMIMNENFSTITKNSSTDRERKSCPLLLAPQKNTGTCFKEMILPSANVFH